MSPRVLFLLPVLLAFLPAPASAEDDFAAACGKLVAGITQEIPVRDRKELVASVAKFDSEGAAKALLTAVQDMSAKLDQLLKRLAAVEKKYEPLDTNLDVERDEYKKRDSLRAEIAEIEAKISDDREVLTRIRKAFEEFTAAGARKVVLGATGGGSWRERALTVRAAASYEGPEAAGVVTKALKEKDARVVIQALYGLKDRKDTATADAIIDLLDHDVWVVIVSAADALAEIGAPQAVRPLIEALGRTRGRVQDDINTALNHLTGQKFLPDYESWKAWYEENKADYEGAGSRPLARGPRGDGGDVEGRHFYGIRTRSKRIVYLLDISGSMDLEIGGGPAVSPRPGEEERVSGPKIEIAKSELKNAIRQLPDDAEFNIITFNHQVQVWQKGMVVAKQKKKNEAYLFINDQKASGSTYTYGALKEAFKLAGMGARDVNYDTGADTIFLLSDGAPTDQSFPTSKPMDPEVILQSVRQWNQLQRIVIHAIAIDPNTQGSSFIRFMRQIAEENGGDYVERG